MRNFVLLFVLGLLLKTNVLAKTDVRVVSVMTYNLENLFDTKHDKGKVDWTYLSLKEKRINPKVAEYCESLSNEHYKKSCLELDWSQDVIDQKIKNLSDVILSYEGVGADVVVFQEIENIHILKELASKGLVGRGYKYFSLIEGPDTRGIDVAVMSRFPIINEKYHGVSLAPHSSRTTRGILESTLKVGSKIVTIFANHWPSQGNVDETRLAASEVLKQAALDVKADLVIAAGDFNTLHDDKPHGIKQNILPFFEDVEVLGRKHSKVVAKGTHWYKGVWESIDKIFVLKSSLKSKRNSVDYKSFRILFENFMLTDLEWTDWETGTVHKDYDIPRRFNSESREGYSDHLPVAVRINL